MLSLTVPWEVAKFLGILALTSNSAPSYIQPKQKQIFITEKGGSYVTNLSL